MRWLALVATVLVFTCARPPRWSIEDKPTTLDAALVLRARDMETLAREWRPDELAAIPVRQRLRPCCAFGEGLSVKVATVPVPFFKLANVIGPDDLGSHTYDSGAFRIKPPGGYSPDQLVPFEAEGNGLVYTCRGGFVDTAHVRDYVDWAFYVGAWLAIHLETGATAELPPEAGSRRLVLKSVPEQLVVRYGRLRLATAMAQWLAFQMSLWHEIATSYGWSSVPGFSEEASAFSPEDLYSNMLGIKMALGLAAFEAARDEHVYNSSVDAWMAVILKILGAVPAELGVEAMRSVDEIWWDSNARLPDKRLVLRRNFDIDDPILPWLIPASRAPEGLREICGGRARPDGSPRWMPFGSGPLPLSNPSSFQSVVFRDWVTLELEVDEEHASKQPFPTLGLQVTQDDFPAIIQAIRFQNREEFGPDADRPG